MTKNGSNWTTIESGHNTGLELELSHVRRSKFCYLDIGKNWTKIRPNAKAERKTSPKTDKTAFVLKIQSILAKFDLFPKITQNCQNLQYSSKIS